MKNRALVTKCEGEQCEIMVLRAEACGSCHACNACHAEPSCYRVENTLRVEKGDWIMVEMEDKQFFRRVGLVYILPLLFFSRWSFAEPFCATAFGQGKRASQRADRFS